MNALAAGSARTVLLVLQDKREMYPLSTDAFTRAQGSRTKLVSEYRGALILDRDGSVRKIEHLEVIQPWGRSFGRKLLSRLTDAWQIEVRLTEPLSYSLEEIKGLLIDCSSSPSAADSMGLEVAEMDKLIDLVRTASSVDQLFELLKLPTPEDALDVL